MAKELTQAERKAMVAGVLADLRARPEGMPLTNEEMMRFILRMPGMPEGWTSADIIRELRGPLPEDDPELKVDGRR